MADEPAMFRPGEPGQEREFRHALGMFATGVAIVTGTQPGGRHFGMTINSFVAISLHPPLVGWSLSHTAPSAAAFSTATHFAVNILASNQVELSRRFSRPGEDRFAGTAVHVGEHGLPLIDGAAAYFECRREHQFPAGDHVILVGAVERCSYRRANTLVFSQGRYHGGVAAELTSPRPLDEDSEWEGIA